MSLATRCPACGTVFRVVRDQLKVSEGWVRCGRCSEVFNAGERLFELDPVTAAPAVNPPSAAPPPAATDSAVVAVIGATLPRTPPVEAPVEDPMPDAQAPAATAAAPTVQERRDEAPPVPEQEPALQPEALADVPEAPAAPDTPPAESLGTHTTPPAAPTETPAEPSLDMRPVGSRWSRSRLPRSTCAPTRPPWPASPRRASCGAPNVPSAGATRCGATS